MAFPTGRVVGGALLFVGIASACSSFSAGSLTASQDDAGGMGDGAIDASDAGMSYSDLILSDMPVAYWRFDESTTPSVLDFSGHNVVGVYAGDVTLGVPGAIANDPDTAVQLGAGMVTFGDQFAFDGKSPFAIEAWVKPAPNRPQPLGIAGSFAENVATSGYVFNLATEGSCDGGTDAGTDAGADAGTCRPADFTPLGGGPTVGTLGYVATGRWNHVVATYDGVTMRIYVNGQVGGTDALPDLKVTSTGEFRVGEWTNTATGFGAIDEMAIYDHDLAQTRVTAHYQRGMGL